MSADGAHLDIVEQDRMAAALADSLLEAASEEATSQAESAIPALE